VHARSAWRPFADEMRLRACRLRLESTGGRGEALPPHILLMAATGRRPRGGGGARAATTSARALPRDLRPGAGVVGLVEEEVAADLELEGGTPWAGRPKASVMWPPANGRLTVTSKPRRQSPDQAAGDRRAAARPCRSPTTMSARLPRFVTEARAWSGSRGWTATPCVASVGRALGEVPCGRASRCGRGGAGCRPA
jgi:hypothetical protein